MALYRARMVVCHGIRAAVHSTSKTATRLFSQSPWASTAASTPVDAWYIPIEPSKGTAQSTTDPTVLSDRDFIRLHRLSALVPPKTGSPEFTKLKNDLQAMLAIVDSVKEFRKPKNDLHPRIPDGRIWPSHESIPVDWDLVVTSQHNFLNSRAESMPGVRTTTAAVESFTTDNESEDLHETELVLGMASEGVHTVRRRGIGQQPQIENTFYVSRNDKLGKDA